MSQLKALFQTQIYYKTIGQAAPLIKDLKIESLQLKTNDQEGHVWSKQYYPSGYTSYSSTSSGYDRMHMVSSTFQTLKKRIDRHVVKYLEQLDYDVQPGDLAMTHCWVNVMGKGSAHASHAHPLSVISGTFYVDVPKGASCLKLEDPRMGLFMNSPTIKAKAKSTNQRLVEIKPASGYLVLFESWLKHEVPVNQSQKERISISFNYGWN